MYDDQGHIADRVAPGTYLAAQRAVTQILGQTAGETEAVPRLLHAICDRIGWDLAESWHLDADSGLLHVHSARCAPAPRAPEFRIVDPEQAFASRDALPGRVWASGSPLWVADAKGDPRLLTASAAAGKGVTSVLAFPITARDAHVDGVMAFYSIGARERDEELIDGAADLGRQIGMFFEHKRVEGELRRTAERYREMVENAHDVIYTHDLEGNLLWANEMALTIYGYTRDEISELNINEIIDPAHLPAAREHLAATIREPETGRHVELLTRAKDGRAIWIEVNTRLVSESGRPAAIQGIARDITRRKAAEEALRESEEFLRMIATSAPIVLFALDREGVFVRSEGKGLAALGLSPGELVGRSVWEVHRDEPAILDNVRRALRGESFTSIVEVRGATLDAWHLPLRSPDGEVTGVAGVAVDITDRKKTEEALRASEEHLRQIQKLDAVGRLAGGVAHDFNNILTVISGYCEFLVSRYEEGDPNREDVEEIRRAAERAAVLTRQLLAFGRKQMLKPKVLDLNEIISDMGTLLRGVLGGRVELRTILAPDLGRVSADPGQIEQVIMNLVVNAGDAMPDGGAITLETKNVELSAAHATWKITAAPGPYAMVAVSDTGKGIDPEVRDRIFEPFFTTKEKGAGSGLGLSTAYGIVKQSGGYIWVYSEPNRGTTFKVYLPRVDGAAAGGAVRAAEPMAAKGSGTILLVEDEDGVRALVRETLRRAGYSVLEAGGGPEALEIARRHGGKIELMVTDVVMPHMSGRELAERMASLRPETRVLYVSGYTENAISRHGVLDEGVAFLGKPFTPDELTRTVRGLLGADRG